MKKIVVNSDVFADTEFTLEAEDLLLGRHTDCQLHQIFRDIPGVSRKHARIRTDGDQCFLEDLGSRNGTLHNGRKIGDAVLLRSGDKLSIGGVSLTYIDEDEFLSAAPDANLHSSESICSTIHVSHQATKNNVAREAPRKFRALIGMLGKIGDSLDTETVLEGLLEGMFDIFDNVQHGFVAVKTADGTVTPQVVKQRNAGTNQESRLSQTIVGRVMSGKEAVLSRNATADARFQHNQSVLSQDISSLMCTPLVNRAGECLGVVQLETADTTPFSPDDLEVLASITPQAAIAIDYARVHEEALKRQAIERDLEFARQIQRNFLPSKEPDLSDYQFFSYYEAAYHVGGDYYDYLKLPDGRLGVVIADVAGKGIAASLIMSKFAGEFKYLLSREGTLAQAMMQMNDALLADTGIRFITVAAMILDATSHRIEIVNAGHSDTLLRSAVGELRNIDDDVKGTPIGMFPGQQYNSKEIQLSPGDALVLYTDGLSEATNAEMELYGVERISNQVAQAQADPNELGTALLEDVRQFVGAHPQSDDMCLICMQRAK